MGHHIIIGLLQVYEEAKRLESHDMVTFEGLDQAGGLGDTLLQVAEASLGGAEA